MLRSNRVSWLILITGVLAGVAVAREPQAKPNVVFFLIDDLGWADLGVTGSTYYETPNVDALAKEGVFFSNAYAANPVCSPTRASIMLGKYPSRIGLTNHSGSSGARGEKYELNPPAVVGNVPLEDTTLAEALKEAGYTTAHFGKWHLQTHNEEGRTYYPEANGFDINVAGHKMGQPGSYYFPYTSERNPSTNVPDMEDGKEGDYLTDALTDKAVQFIESNCDKPFFLNMWYYTVHTPINPRKDKLDKYRKKAVAMGLDATRRDAVPDHQSFSHAHQDNPDYACMVESMDENVGRILNTLRRLKLDNDTIVIFFSDNGGLSTGSGPTAPTSSFPLRAGKAWVYEGGIRVPLIIRFPNIGNVLGGGSASFQGVEIKEPVISTDLYPTILDLAGLPLRPEQHVDGLSLKSLMTGKAKTLEREAIYFHYPHYHHINTMGPAGAIRMGDYKLIEVFETGEVELYNLSDDLGEQDNLSLSMPELADKLQKMLNDWQKRSGARLPTRNPDWSEENDWRKKQK